MRFVTAADLPGTLDNFGRQGQRCGVLVHSAGIGSAAPHARCILPSEPEGYARGLYATLRKLDQAGNDIILVEVIPQDPAWAAVADRLRRATFGSGAEQSGPAG